MVFKDAAGRVLTIRDLKGFTGRVSWEVIDDDAYVPETAKRLHQEARAHGGRFEFDPALALLDRARRLAPDWPYPVYDMAFTYLLQDQTAKAEELYAKGLEARPDIQTKGMLLIGKANMLFQRGDRERAIWILGDLALDPASTLGTEMCAKAVLALANAE